MYRMINHLLDTYMRVVWSRITCVTRMEVLVGLHCDTFDVNTPLMDDLEYISSLGATIFSGMQSGDVYAMWLMQVKRFYLINFSIQTDEGSFFQDAYIFTNT
ncbi:hypothetical protein QQP08_009509 [Theobroma cacao]|uniref:Uncharacterized protein n=1 Tax=Theobroma cacao TaxID=3641 RepID=A0A061FTC4_THECC|nr:Uncharacterized protein TCM_011978 [Theobroma cacao]WRX17022.1 hypothetical protein QQP08_009509 [Theobroma cacao]